MVLSSGKTGNEYTVENIRLERDIKRRLEVLGLTDGTRVKVLNQKRSGAMIIKFRGTRFAVGQRIAEHIFVGGVS